MTNSRRGSSGNTDPGKRQPMSDGERRVREYASGRMHHANQVFHLKLKHLLGGVSLLSLLAAFEVFSIPATSGIIDLLQVSKATAGAIWIGVAALSGGMAVVLHEEEY